MARLYKIGEAISILQQEYRDLSASALRFWEMEGLITPYEKTPGSQRLYSDEDLDLLRYIKEMSLANYSIKEMGGKIKKAREDINRWKGSTFKKYFSTHAERFKRQKKENKLYQDLSHFIELDRKGRWESVYNKRTLANLLSIEDSYTFIDKAEKFGLIKPRTVKGEKRYASGDEMILKIIIFIQDINDKKYLKKCSRLEKVVEYLYELDINPGDIKEDFEKRGRGLGDLGFRMQLFHIISDRIYYTKVERKFKE